jgi:NAD-dependent DNA ligase
MKGSERGSTLIWWVIVLLVLFVIASVLAYVQFTDNADMVRVMEQVRADNDRLEQRERELIAERLALWEAIGFRGDSELDPSNLETMNEKIGELRGKLNTVTESDETLERVIRGLEAAYDDAVRSAADANAKYEEARQAEQSAEDETDAVAEQKESEIASLREQLRAEQDRAARNQGQAQETIDAQRDTITRLQDELATRSEEWKRDKNLLENRLLAMDARMQEINERNRLIREKDVPDGTIVDSDEKLGLVYVDLGLKHGLMRGTRFQVWTYGKGKVRIPKGWVEVREVKPDYAVAGIVETLDPYNPISSGDRVSNPYFDRDKKPEFVFLGVFPGRYDHEEASRLLREKGAIVADEVTANTDFLVMGEKPAGEAEPELEERDNYRRAVQYGVEILRAPELIEYLRY